VRKVLGRGRACYARKRKTGAAPNALLKSRHRQREKRKQLRAYPHFRPKFSMHFLFTG
jgi:hypothetical protein